MEDEMTAKTQTAKFQTGDRVECRTDNYMNGATGTVEYIENSRLKGHYNYGVRMDGGALWEMHDCDLVPAA